MSRGERAYRNAHMRRMRNQLSSHSRYDLSRVEVVDVSPRNPDSMFPESEPVFYITESSELAANISFSTDRKGKSSKLEKSVNPKEPILDGE